MAKTLLSFSKNVKLSISLTQWLLALYCLLLKNRFFDTLKNRFFSHEKYICHLTAYTIFQLQSVLKKMEREGLKMDEKESLLSIVVLDIARHYMIPITLESIFIQEEKNFELIILAQNILPKELALLRSYADRGFSPRLKIVEAESKLGKVEIKNKALEITKGKYIHFLFPGEYYLSKFSLSYLFEEIERKNYPDLIFFSSIHRAAFSPPKIVHPTSLFGHESFLFSCRNLFFLKKSLVKVGGFDLRYSNLEAYDLITKIHLNKKFRIFYCQRVVVDYEEQKYTSQKIFSNILELLRIIYHNYGLRALFRKALFKEIIDFIKSELREMKGYFRQSEV
jgi:hypothetical protein